MQEDTVPNDAPGAEYADGDYGYDLAHEATGEASATAPPAGRPEPPRIEPAAQDSGGDYGVVAHRARPRRMLRRSLVGGDYKVDLAEAFWVGNEVDADDLVAAGREAVDDA